MFLRIRNFVSRLYEAWSSLVAREEAHWEATALVESKGDLEHDDAPACETPPDVGSSKPESFSLTDAIVQRNAEARMARGEKPDDE